MLTAWSHSFSSSQGHVLLNAQRLCRQDLPKNCRAMYDHKPSQYAAQYLAHSMVCMLESSCRHIGPMPATVQLHVAAAANKALNKAYPSLRFSCICFAAHTQYRNDSVLLCQTLQATRELVRHGIVQVSHLRCRRATTDQQPGAWYAFELQMQP